MSRILDERRDFDLVFCLTDMIAIGALKALLDHGVGVPRDVAIMGFDGVRDGRYTSPGLSSVDIDVAQIASTCLDLLIERIDAVPRRQAPEKEHRTRSAADITPRTRTLDYRLVFRGSAERSRG